MDEPPFCGGEGLEEGGGCGDIVVVDITTVELLLDVDDRVEDELREVIPPSYRESHKAEVGQMGEPPGESFHGAVKSYWSDCDCLRMNGGKGLF